MLQINIGNMVGLTATDINAGFTNQVKLSHQGTQNRNHTGAGVSVSNTYK